MSDPLKPLQPGNPLPTSVRTWNPMLRAARQAVDGPSAGDTRRNRPPDVWIKNSTGADIDRGNVLLVKSTDSPEVLPADSVGQFQSKIVLKGSKFSGSDKQPATAFVVAEPIVDGKLGGAWCTGIIATQLDILDADHQFARYAEDSVQFKTGESGWPIIWKESGTGVKWALVSLATVGEGTTIAFVQAPSGGLPARVGATPGEADCKIVVVAASAGTGYAAGDLVSRAEEIGIKNWGKAVHGANGDRVIQVAGHFEGAFIVGDDCDASGSPSDIKAEVEVIP